MTYNFSSPVIGAPDMGVGYTETAPGTAVLPGAVLEPQLGEIRHAWDPTLGWAEFIYLKVPTATTITAGLLYQWSGDYTVAVLPVLATSKNTGHQVAVAVTSLTSTTPVNYGWFQISGKATVLKTAVQVLPDAKLYASGTAGRVKVLTSAGGEITGMRNATVTTVTSTTSTITAYLNRPALQGQIT